MIAIYMPNTIFKVLLFSFLIHLYNFCTIPQNLYISIIFKYGITHIFYFLPFLKPSSLFFVNRFHFFLQFIVKKNKLYRDFLFSGGTVSKF